MESLTINSSTGTARDVVENGDFSLSPTIVYQVGLFRRKTGAAETLAWNPFGTTEASCQRCGCQLTGGLCQAEQIASVWTSDPTGWIKQEERFLKA